MLNRLVNFLLNPALHFILVLIAVWAIAMSGFKIPVPPDTRTNPMYREIIARDIGETE